MSAESILTKHCINNPADAALVRVANAAAAFPDESADNLATRSNITNENDRKLAIAIVESVRAGTPAPKEPSKTERILSIGLGVLLFAVGAWAYSQSTTSATEIAALNASNAKLKADLSAAVAAKGSGAEALTKQNDAFVTGMKALGSTTEKLQGELTAAMNENARLQLRVASLEQQLATAKVVPATQK